MKTHFVSDTHWGHTNIIKYSNRPFASVPEMNEALIANWNAVVQPGDTVWHLGDVSFSKYPETKSILSRLNGNKNLVLGNHDQVITANKDDLLNSGIFKSIQNYAEISIQGTKVILFHYGQRVWNKSHHGSIMLYGHSHGSLPPFGKSVDVGVDCKEITPAYRPVSEDEVLAYMKGREGEVVDHHGAPRM